MCRKRGRIILVGVIGLDLKRSDFYEKNLNFKYLALMGQVGMTPIVRIWAMTIQFHLLDGQSKEILSQF